MVRRVLRKKAICNNGWNLSGVVFVRMSVTFVRMSVTFVCLFGCLLRLCVTVLARR